MTIFCRHFFKLFIFLTFFSAYTYAGYTLVEDKVEVSIKSPTLKNVERQKLRLNNGLEAYLVSDPDAIESGAALSVGVGWNHEPFNRVGVAHFVEHMLFMGTNKYPIEKEYHEFITNNGGMANAFTSSDRTVYYFKVKNNSLKEALDRFSCFFVSPLFNESGLEREKNAVNQEMLYRANLDGIRLHMIKRSLLNPNSHAQIWRCGNLDTLKDVSRDEIVQWYENHYSANLMKLVVYSAMPMNELVEYVDTHFSQIKNKNLKFDGLKNPVSLSEHKGVMVYAEPLHDVKYLVLSWELPTQYSHDLQNHAASILSEVFHEDSPQSVATVLKEKQLINNLYASHDSDDAAVNFFEITAELTQEGLEKRDEVISSIFQAIQTFKQSGIPRYRFDEIKALAQLNYSYQPRPALDGFLPMSAYHLHDEPLETYPANTSWAQSFDKKKIMTLLGELGPQKATYFVMAPKESLKKEFDQVEPIAKTKFALEPISDKTLCSWSQIQPSLDIAVAPPNAYIPTNLKIVTTKADFAPNNAPILLRDDELFKVYYAPDDEFEMPGAHYALKLASPSFGPDAQNRVLGDLFLLSLHDELAQLLDQGEQAGLMGNFSLNPKTGLNLTVAGYSDKSQKFLKNILYEVSSHKPKSENFSKYYDQLLRSYENSKKVIPGKLASQVMQNVIIKDDTTADENIVALKQTYYEDLLTYSQSLFEKIYVRSFIYGNVTKKEAENCVAFLKDTFNYSVPYALNEQYKPAILDLNEEKSPFYLTHSTDQVGSAAYLFISHGQLNESDRASFDVLNNAISTPFFETLRTKQQVGYITRAAPKEVEENYFSAFLVQSNSCSSRDLLSRYELFIEEFLSSLGNDEFNEDKFENIKDSLIQNYLQPDTSLFSKGQKLTELAFRYNEQFDLYQKRAQSLKNLSFESFSQFCKEQLGRQNSRRIAVLVNGKMSDQPTIMYEPIMDLSHFKAENLYKPNAAIESLKQQVQ